jgi:hypothetical protein
MNKIKTTTRNVKQPVRKFTDEQRKQILYQIDYRPSNVKKIDLFKKFGMGHGGNLYYTWKKKFGKSMKPKPSGNVPMNVPMNSKTTKNIYTVTLSVEAGSIMELIGICIDIKNTPKVKSIHSVI